MRLSSPFRHVFDRTGSLMASHSTAPTETTRGRRVLPLVVMCVLGVANMAPGSCSSFSKVTDTGTPPPASDPTHTAEQAETALTTFDRPDGARGGVVFFNDDTGEPNKHIFYGADTRQVIAGYSGMGWAYSTNNGTNWVYGGKVAPSSDFPIIWSDPGVTGNTFGNGAFKGYVWSTMLAVPKVNMPTSGTINGSLFGLVAGACIAKSTDSGVHFSLSQCFTHSNHLYDGANMVADATGLVCAAYNDQSFNQMDVWCAHGILDTFKMTSTQPFAGIPMGGHPRMRATDDGHIYIVAPKIIDQNKQIYQLLINVYDGANWGTPRAISDLDLARDPSIQTNPGLRVGPQYSFDVGNASIAGSDNIRLVYTIQGSDGRYHFKGYACDMALNCLPQPAWGTDPGLQGSQFNPKMKKSPQIFDASGNLMSDEEWKVAFYTEDGLRDNQVAVREGNLAVIGNPGSAVRVFANDQFIQPHPICPDTRGYWGDYDEVQFMRGDATTNYIPSFIVMGTDSSDGTCVSTQYVATPMHIDEVIWK